MSFNLTLLTPVMAVIFRVGLLDVINLNFSFFSLGISQMKKILPTAQKLWRKQYYCLADPVIIC
jgi:HD-like signal output (HDOD) protein